MYVPAHFAVDEVAVHELLARHGAADLVTLTSEGLVATMLPFAYVPAGVAGSGVAGSGMAGSGMAVSGGAGSGGAGSGVAGKRSEHGSLYGHLARNNAQWKLPALGEALAIVRGPDAYISPAFYASKAEHGRVVPTWNYVTAHVYGELIIHDDAQWTEAVVRRLTAKHEASNSRPWSVDDAPRAFIDGQLRAIVGIELLITRIEAKAKLSQNRSVQDVTGVIDGLRERGDTRSADLVERASVHRSQPSAG